MNELFKVLNLYLYHKYLYKHKYTMEKENTFKVNGIIDLGQNSFHSLVDSRLKEVGSVVIKDGEISMYLITGEEVHYNSDYSQLMKYVNEKGLYFVNLTEDSRWVEYNPNPLGKNVDDCSIRSYCAAKDVEWDTAFNWACEIAEREKDIINSGSVCHQVVTEKIGMVLNKKSKKIKPKDRPTVMEFVCMHPTGTYILDCPKHFVTTRAGFYYDSFNSGKMKVKGYYEFKEEDLEDDE